MSKRFESVRAVRLATLAFAIGCSDANAVFDDSYLSAAGTSNDSGAGAGTASGGGGTDVPSSGGTGATAGMTPNNEEGGALSESGAASVGGTEAMGGSTTTGGTTAQGGTETTGGTTTGGTEATGGSAMTGGAAGSGGHAGGGGGAPTTGGNAGAGGTGVVTYGEPVTMESQNVANTFVISCSPQVNYGADPTLVIDNEPCQAEILLKPSVAEVPQDALVKKATLSLTCTNPGPGLSVFRPEWDWSAEGVTWTTRPTATVSLGSIGAINEGTFVIDVTTVAQAWVDGSRKPFGIVLRTDQSDGLIFSSSRAQDAKQRPKFSVTYAVPLK